MKKSDHGKTIFISMERVVKVNIFSIEDIFPHNNINSKILSQYKEIPTK